MRELAAGEGVILLCGRFEGFDERIFEARDVEPVSIGDYVLSGGELGAMVLLDACVRLLPGVMGAASSGEEESFESGASRISALYPTSHMGRAHDPRSAAVGGSCEDRGVATRTRGRRYTAKAAGPDRAPRGRIAGTALWRAARKRRRRPMNLIETLEREAIEALTADKPVPEFRPGDTLRVGVKVVEGDRSPRPEFRRRLHRPLEQGRRLQLHRPQDQLRRRRRARLPALFAGNRFDRGRPPRRRPPRQALLSARPHR